MVHHHQSQRYYHHPNPNLKKGEVDDHDNGTARGFKRAQPRLLFLASLSLLSFTLIIWTCHPFAVPPACSLLLDPPEGRNQDPAPLCSSISNGTICCDRSSHRTDICFMGGDVRTHSESSSIFLYTREKNAKSPVSVSVPDIQAQEEQHQIEKVRPYTRKWETSVMSTIQELKLVSTTTANPWIPQSHKCDVYHNVPAVLFSTGGYTGNVYHEFNDGIIPLYITSQHLKKKVVFVILEYHNWWLTKYGNILSHLSDYPPIDFNGDKRTHCFPEAVVGLRIHDELTVDSSAPFTQGSATIRDFRSLLDRAYRPRISGIIKEEQRNNNNNEKTGQLLRSIRKPRLVILSRNGSRSINNEGLLVKMAENTGFSVQVLKPDRTSELAKIYRSLNSSDVMIGVHGAAMTHFLFMRPGSVFIQVIPLGTEWAAATYYGEPAVKLGLEYVGYKILPRESSLYGQYHKDDPVLTDPGSVVKKGWQFTKRIYLDNQSVHIDLNRFKRRLLRAYDYIVSKPSFQTQVAPH